MKSDMCFGYDATCTHVLISAIVPDSLPLLSILSDLSEKMSLEQEQNSVVGSQEGWWR
jgi:hypothetical protein